MLTYKYTAKDPVTGKKIKGEVEADSESAAARVIKAQGHSLMEIHAAGGNENILTRLTNRITTKDKVIFSRQLSTLINAGLPLVQSLRTVMGQTKKKNFQFVISQVITDVEAGKALSVSLQKHPRVFNQVYTSLVAAGETSGTLDNSLERLANQQEKDAELTSKVRGALIYPGIVLLVMGGVVTFMIVAVLPQVKELYAGLPGANLPFITVALLAVSDLVINFWWLALILTAIGIFFGTRWARTLGGKRFVDSVKMKAWPIGRLFMKLYMARFARTGTTLVASGVPLLQTLQVTGRAIDNIHLEESIAKASEKVKGGKSLSEAISGDQNFLDLVPQMIKIGEDSGSLEQMLDRTATYFEKEVDNEVKAISTIIEPVLMIVLGVVSLIIVGAILLPIYGLVGSGVIG
ncbi:MAG: type II secretion system F family protein [bacterium]|nr:type II secretion system F family protein [bacterium]